MRERPLVYLSPPVAVAMYCAVCLGWKPGLNLSLLLLSVTMVLAGAVVVRYNRAFEVCCMLMAASVAFTVMAVYDRCIVEPVRYLREASEEVTAVAVGDADIYETQQRVELKVDWEPGFRTLCYFPLTDEPILAGDKVAASLSFYLPNSSDGFDRASFQAAEGRYISASCTLDDDGNPVRLYIDRSDEQSWRWLPQRIQRRFKEAAKDVLPEREAGLLAALLIGDHSGLNDDDALSLRIAGMSHLIAVSGLHVGFLVAFCCLIFGRFLGTGVSVLAVLMFMLVAGCTSSVVRASVMYFISAGAFYTLKDSDALNSMCIAFLILLAANPYSIASVGLQLSFTATLGIILFENKLQKRMMEPMKGWTGLAKSFATVITGAVSCTLCATMFTAPVLLSTFGRVSVMAVFSNLLTVGVTAVCFIIGFVLCIFSGLFTSAAKLVAWLETLLLDYILWVAETISAIPFGQVDGRSTFGVAALLLGFALLLLWIIKGRRVKWKFVLPVVCMLYAGIFCADAYYDSTQYTVTYLPCGSGQAVIVEDRGHMALIDCGGDGKIHNAASSVREWMLWNGIKKIDTVVLTAVDKTHARDLEELLENVPVDDLLIPDGVKETKNNAEILECVRTYGAKTAGENRIIDGFPITVFPVVDGKLGVSISGHTLILHSPTLKQLAAFLEDNGCSAPMVVLSERNIDDSELLGEALDRLGAETVMLQTGWSEPLTLEGRPVESPHRSGEIQKRYARG